MSPEDQELLAGCREGSEAAWAALYRIHAPDVGQFLGGMLRLEQAQIDDLVQKVFLEFVRSLHRFRGESSLRTWLHRIARHVALHELRSQRRRRRHLSDYRHTVSQTSPSHEASVLARQRLRLVQGLLDELDEPFREVWMLREIQGFSPQECAAILELPSATVRTRHHRARRRLLELLADLDATVLDRPQLRLVGEEEP